MPGNDNDNDDVAERDAATGVASAAGPDSSTSGAATAPSTAVTPLPNGDHSVVTSAPTEGAPKVAPLLSDYVPLGRQPILEEVERLREAARERNALWEAELAIYEGTGDDDGDDGEKGEARAAAAAAGNGETKMDEEDDAAVAAVLAAASAQAALSDGGAAAEIPTSPRATPAPQARSPPPSPPKSPGSFHGTNNGNLGGRRNYPNASGTVVDPRLFPYSDVLYPLIDSYGDEAWQLPRRAVFDGEMEVEGSMPCSVESMLDTVLVEYRAAIVASPTAYATDDMTELSPEGVMNAALDRWGLEEVRDAGSLWRLSSLPPDSPLLSRTPRRHDGGTNGAPPPLGPGDWPVLLKILRHAVSDLQRDFSLAASAILCMTQLLCCDVDADCVRGLIAVVCGNDDYPHSCQGGCHGDFDELPNHSCLEFHIYLRSIRKLLVHGIFHFTEEHATIVSACFLSELDHISASKIDDAFFDYDSSAAAGIIDAQSARSSISGCYEGGSSGKSKLERRKILLKQNLYHYGTTPAEFKRRLVGDIICGIGQHAALDRIRMTHAKRAEEGTDMEEDGPSASYEQVRDSWVNCVRTLVNVAESSLRRLPQNEVAREIGGLLVRAFVDAFVSFEDDAGEERDENGRRILKDYDLLNPNRYARSVTSASDDCYDLENRTSITGGHLLTPPRDVLDVVRALILRDLVDITVSGCGYGDWLSVCRLPVTPLDPLLYDRTTNYYDYENDDGALESQYDDEDGNILTGSRLDARYDFSLLMLIHAWRAPWTPRSHRSFQSGFKHAARSLALCFQRHSLPSEMVNLVVAFLPRDWWRDERRRCWSYDCQMKDTVNMMRSKMATRELSHASSSHPKTEIYSNTIIHSCKKCRVVLYCCKEHKKSIMQDGHKRVCGNPPFRVPGKDEAMLIQSVLEYDRQKENEGMATQEDESERHGSDDSALDESDGDSSWESVEDSVDEEKLQVTKTDIIFSFFSKAYKVMRQEPHAFANFFAYE